MSSSDQPDMDVCRQLKQTDASLELQVWQPGEILHRSKPWHCVFIHLQQQTHSMFEQLLALSGQWPTVILGSKESLVSLANHGLETLDIELLQSGELAAAVQAAIFKHKLHHLQNSNHDKSSGVLTREALFQRCHQILVKDQQPSYVQVVQCRWINVANGEVSWRDVQALKKSFADYICQKKPHSMVAGQILDDKTVFLTPDFGVLDGDWLSKFQQQCESEFSHLRVAFYKSSPVLLTDGESFSLGLQQAVQQIARERLEQEAKFEWPAYQQATTTISDSLHQALQNRQFFLEYQPQVSSQDGEWVGIEVLMRWKHPSLGIIPPTAFIKEAENIGLLPVLGRWSLHEAMRAWKLIYIETGRQVRISVNVAFQQIQEMDFSMDVMEALASNEMPANCLELEITETSVIKDEVVSKENLKYLLDAGVHISLDDFGTGYSSLTHLIDLPISGVKLDRAFITAMKEESAQLHIAEAVISLAKKLNLETTAEGVEDLQCLRHIQQLHCDRIQGYYVARPLSLDKLLFFADDYDAESFNFEYRNEA